MQIVRIFDAARLLVDDLEHVVGIGMIVVDVSRIAATLYIAPNLIVIEHGIAESYTHGKSRRHRDNKRRSPLHTCSNPDLRR